MQKQLIKGNEALVKGALLAGCTQYYGYPITPASEVAHAAAKHFPLAGGTFVQSESETAAINMVYGAAAAGARALTASSGPGISLKCEGISYLAGSELPAVIADIMRAGPGLGNIWPEQSDYNQVVKGGGHGNYKNLVFAPNSAQEMCDLTIKAFEKADQYRIPAFILSDAYVGQMMEPVEFPETIQKSPKKDWAVSGTAETRKNLVTSIVMSSELLEEFNRKLQDKYALIEQHEQLSEEYYTKDASLIITAYGITSRIAQSAIDIVRSEGLKVGMLRPITLFPFPKKAFINLLPQTKAFLVIEMSNGQMIDDVKLTIEHQRPVHFYNRMGGMIPEVLELADVIRKTYQKVHG